MTATVTVTVAVPSHSIPKCVDDMQEQKLCTLLMSVLTMLAVESF